MVYFLTFFVWTTVSFAFAIVLCGFAVAERSDDEDDDKDYDDYNGKK